MANPIVENIVKTKAGALANSGHHLILQLEKIRGARFERSAQMSAPNSGSYKLRRRLVIVETSPRY